MSWQTYVDDHLLSDLGRGQQLSSAAIIGQDGTVWAQSETFPATKPGEIEALVKALVDPDVGVPALAQSGLFLGGIKYMVIQGEAGIVIRGKKGTGGVCVKRTNSAVIIGIYDEPVTPGECNVVVERLGDYLLDQGI
eukprot:TRINITY_DN12100_c0_g1_i1.p1 TRINITY_DN12100_c0_g1~~TRINITY_DN12100_c0_g1_i1.p1  ORF type:complete len:137 (+),score=16.25 TRINITY_DN12100_c0_g1_i1:214-624(+)